MKTVRIDTGFVGVAFDAVVGQKCQILWHDEKGQHKILIGICDEILTIWE